MSMTTGFSSCASCINRRNDVSRTETQDIIINACGNYNRSARTTN